MRRRDVPPVPPFSRSMVFEKMVPVENCFRRYEIVLEQRGDYWVVITWRGRIGKTLRPLEDVCETEDEARAIADRRAHQRFLHGYDVVGIDETRGEVPIGPAAWDTIEVEHSFERKDQYGRQNIGRY